MDKPSVEFRPRTWLVTALLLVVVPLLATACGGTAGVTESAPPAVVEHVKGSQVDRIRLTAEASKRIGIRTALVRSANAGRLVIPYDALLYDPDGKTWTYTNPAPLVFRRQNVAVVRVEGASVLLNGGPAPGTRVVTQGATELWGVEYGGIKED
jgi:hypothetical protein